MSKRDDLTFLEDMLERVDLVAEFTVDGRDEFMQSKMMQEAVIRGLEIIGEASRNVSETLRDAHPEVPWRQIAAFRNFVSIHTGILIWNAFGNLSKRTCQSSNHSFK